MPPAFTTRVRQLLKPAQRDSAGLLSMWSARPIEPEALAAEARPVDPGDADVRCVLSLGAALLGYGLPAHRVEESVLRLARAFGLSCSVFGLPTALMITVRGPRHVDLHTVRAEPGTIDLARLDALHRLVARVERGELTAVQADEQVAAVLSAPRPLPRFFDLLAIALVAFGGTIMLGARASDAVWSAALGLGTGALLLLGRSHTGLARVVPVVTALLVTVASCALAHAGVIAHPLVVAFAALFVLLPGLTLTLAMVELATGHIVSGTARSTGAGAVFLQLGFGVLLGVRLGRLDDATVAALAPAALWPAASGAALLSIGFAILFAIRLRDLGQTLAVSALAFFGCRLTSEALGVELGVLIAACAVGLCSHVYASKVDRPSSTLTLPGVAMLVPGSLGLMSVSAAAMRDPTRAFDVGFQMLMVLIALSTGILLSAAALPPRSGV